MTSPMMKIIDPVVESSEMGKEPKIESKVTQKEPEPVRAGYHRQGMQERRDLQKEEVPFLPHKHSRRRSAAACGEDCC